MESQPQQIGSKSKNTKTKSFLVAVLLSITFIIVCVPFLINASDLSYSEKAFVGAINLWRIVIGFGILSIITTILFVIKQKNQKLTVLFLWLFWILGVSLIWLISGFLPSVDILTSHALNKSDIVANTVAILPYIIWLLGIYYCEKIARRLSMNENIAILAGMFLPMLSLLVYFFYAYRKNTKEGKIRTIKITAGIAMFFSFVLVGTAYYVIGTPEYSLYKLKKAIIENNNPEFEKYLDIKSVAEKHNEDPDQFQDELITSMNTSFLEIKEENSDKGKDAISYVYTGLMGKSLKNASVVFSQNAEPLYVRLKFGNEGAKLLSEITKRNIGKSISLFLGGQLVAYLSIQSEIVNGEIMFPINYNTDQARVFVERINEEKDGMVAGFKIKEKIINGDSARIRIGIIGKEYTVLSVDVGMIKMAGRYWRITQVDLVGETNEKKLPSPEGVKLATFNWKYKGKNYTLEEKLYDSFYKFYNSLPAESVFNGESLIGWQEKNNELFINEVDGDKTISELAQSIKSLGEKNNLSENQVVELVSTFVQAIPYDYEELKNIDSGNHKVDYPYEVLYKNKGICSDKSYLAYSLLKDLGYGVSFFLFPEDRHIAIGVKCPAEYSNYNSGYCFIETTSLGNKIGVTPNILKETGVASSKIELSDFGVDLSENKFQPLGKIEILNKIDGKAYTGIIDAIATQKEIDRLFASINAQGNILKNLNTKIKNEENDLKDMEKKLNSSAKKGNYGDYDNLYSKYSRVYSGYKKDIKEYNNKVAVYNQASNRYNQLVKSFYQ